MRFRPNGVGSGRDEVKRATLDQNLIPQSKFFVHPRKPLPAARETVSREQAFRDRLESDPTV
jgi:hypothetical protein